MLDQEDMENKIADQDERNKVGLVKVDEESRIASDMLRVRNAEIDLTIKNSQ